VLNQGISAIAMSIKLTALAQNHADDMAERKTRHTVLLASERQGDDRLNTLEFWSEIDRRISEETNAPAAKPGVTGQIGLTALHIGSLLAGDLAVIAIALILSPSA
jgi:Flp pilus assembly protein CpaB